MRYAALLCLLVLAGCDREVLDTSGSQLLVATPDLGVVQLDPDLTLRLTPPEFSGPLAVRVGGDAVAFDSVGGAFVLDVQLARGLNAFPVEVADDLDRVERDTLYAVYLPLQSVTVPGLVGAESRADAAASPVGPGTTSISGGSSAGGQALSSVALFQSSGSQIIQRSATLNQPRTGHTASPVADGALLVGGTTSDTPASSSDFVVQAELIEQDGQARTVETEGAIRRTRHTTRVLTLDGVTYLYLYGGVVAAGSGLARTGTVDIYEYRPSDLERRLIRLTPEGGSGGFSVLSDHLQLETGTTSATVLGISSGQSVSFAFDWSVPGTASFPFSLRASPAGGAATPRFRAASADIGGGLSLISGGRDSDDQVLRSLEVYAAQAGRSFLFPPSVQLRTPRFDHTATILPGRRIVIGGGRTTGGGALTAYESFQF